MLLARYKHALAPPNVSGFAVPAGLSVVTLPAIPLVQAPELQRGSRLTLLAAHLEISPAAPGSVSIESAELLVEGVGAVGFFASAALAFGAVTALVERMPIYLPTPYVIDTNELLPTAARFTGAGLEIVPLFSLNNSGLATTLQVSFQIYRWLYELFDDKGE